MRDSSSLVTTKELHSTERVLRIFYLFFKLDDQNQKQNLDFCVSVRVEHVESSLIQGFDKKKTGDSRQE